MNLVAECTTMSAPCSRGLNVGHFRVWVAQRLGKYSLRLRPDGSAEGGRVVDVYGRVANAHRRQRVGNEVERAPVKVAGNHQVVARQQYVLQRIGHRRGSRGHRKCRHAAFECRHALFKHPLCVVGKAPVDVARGA